MHAFFALHSGSNLYKHVFSPGTLATHVTQFYNCFTLFLEVDQVIADHILRKILKLKLIWKSNSFVHIRSTKLVCRFACIFIVA